MAGPIRGALRELDAELPAFIQTWEQDLGGALFPSMVATVSLGVMGLMGAMLAVMAGPAEAMVCVDLENLDDGLDMVLRRSVGAAPRHPQDGVMIDQGPALLGSHGLLPLGDYLDTVAGALGSRGAGFRALPSIFWLASGDGALRAAGWVGVVLSAAVLLGYANALMLAVLCAGALVLRRRPSRAADVEA